MDIPVRVRAIFYRGGGGGGGGRVNYLPKNSRKLPEIFKEQSKRNEGHMMH